jgi:hypothetical protein
VQTQFRSKQYGSVLVNTEVRDTQTASGIRARARRSGPSSADGRTPETVTWMATPELARHVDHVEQTLGLSNAPGGSHPGRGARDFFETWS